jgi:hypothetical protein
MSDETRQIVIAPRLAALASPPGDWQEKIAAIPGVTVLGSSFGRMQVRATDAALADARRELGDLLHFEEVMGRGTAG